MKEKISRTFTQITEAINDSLNSLKDSAKEKGQAFIDDWLQVLPELEAMGLEITSFGISLAISPSMDVEMRGAAAAFTDIRLDQLIAEYSENNYVLLVLKAIRTARKMHRRIGKDDLQEDIHLKITVKVTPEVRVYFGRPFLL